MSWSRLSVIAVVLSSSLLWADTAHAQGDVGEGALWAILFVAGAVILGVCGLIATFAFWWADRSTGPTKSSGEPKWPVAFGCGMGLGVLLFPSIGFVLAELGLSLLDDFLHRGLVDSLFFAPFGAPILTLGAWLWFGVRMVRRRRPGSVATMPSSEGK